MTRLFPNKLEPLWAPWNRQQFGALGRRVDVEVLSTVPWFPGAQLFPSSMAGRLVGVPSEDRIEALHVRHPRYVRLPKWGHGLSAALYAASLYPMLRRERDRYDVLLAAWGYPDAVAAVMLGKLLDLPVAVKLHGSDLNTLARTRTIRMNLEWALPRADQVLAVSRPLKAIAESMGARPSHTRVLIDGVDGTLFHRRDRAAERVALGIEAGKVILFVGHLYEEKGVLDLVDAFERMRSTDAHLYLAGEGGLKATLEARGKQNPRIHVLGPRPHAEIARWLGAADLLALPSWAEGTPGVLLEALASGRPVVMSNVGGIPDVVDQPIFGELVAPRAIDALAGALDRVIHKEHDAQAIIDASGIRDWSESAADLERGLQAAIEAHDTAKAGPRA